MVDGVREKSYFRNWWMTTGAVPDANPQVPVRDEAEEVNAVIDLINVANEAVKKPVFLVIAPIMNCLTALNPCRPSTYRFYSKR
jgi:hypothetical protein